MNKKSIYIVMLVAIVLTFEIVQANILAPEVLNDKGKSLKNIKDVQVSVIIAVMQRDDGKYLLIGLPIHMAIDKVLTRKGFD